MCFRNLLRITRIGPRRKRKYWGNNWNSKHGRSFRWKWFGRWYGRNHKGINLLVFMTSHYWVLSTQDLRWGNLKVPCRKIRIQLGEIRRGQKSWKFSNLTVRISWIKLRWRKWSKKLVKRGWQKRRLREKKKLSHFICEMGMIQEKNISNGMRKDEKIQLYGKLE